jgi:hypothetical protein
VRIVLLFKTNVRPEPVANGSGPIPALRGKPVGEIDVRQLAVSDLNAIVLEPFGLLVAVADVKKARLNPAGDITLGDRVGLGARAVVFRNSQIGSNTVVGWGSVVKGAFPSNVVIAGVPARVVNTNVRWER